LAVRDHRGQVKRTTYVLRQRASSDEARLEIGGGDKRQNFQKTLVLSEIRSGVGAPLTNSE